MLVVIIFIGFPWTKGVDIYLFIFVLPIMEYVIFHSSYIHSLSAEAQDIKIMVIIFQLGFLSPFLQGSFTSTGLVVSSKLPRFSDMYTLTIASADPKSISANDQVHFTKSVTQWYLSLSLSLASSLNLCLLTRWHWTYESVCSHLLYAFWRSKCISLFLFGLQVH